MTPNNTTPPKVEVRTLDDLTPDPQNANKHTQRGHTLVENSLRRRGAFRSVAAAGKNTDKPVVMAGNLTIEKARDAGITEVVMVHTTGNQLVAVVRDDLEPGSAEAIALGLEDNESGKQSYSPDLDLVAALAAGDNAILSAIKAEDKTFASMLERMGVKDGEGENEYSRKIQAPIYTPTGEKPNISDLFDTTRTQELIQEIDAADISEEEREFLRIAARRHTILNYKRIADYYAHSEKATQVLMENSALVIIDFDRAIELGYVKLAEEIVKQYREDYCDR